MNVMVKNQESGYAINIANFENLISYCTAFGPAYNPSNPQIKLTALSAQLTAAKTAIAGVNSALNQYNNATADRENAFEPLNRLATRTINAVAASGADDARIKDIKPIIRKLRGERAKALPEEPANPTAPAPKSVSVSQLSFENKLLNLETLIQLLSGIPTYQPNEPELSVEGLQDLLTDLRTKNSAAKAASTALSNARILRNDTQKNPVSGLAATAREVKMYVKSLYGYSGEQYKQISGLIFKV